MFRLPGHSHRSSTAARAGHAWWPVVPAVLGAAVLALAAGCGSSGTAPSGSGGSAGSTGSAGSASSQSAISAIRAAAQASRHIDSVTASLVEHVSGAAGESTSGTISEQLRPSLLLSMHISAAVAGRQTKVAGIIARSAMYLKISALAAELGGRPWVKIPLTELRSGKSSFASLFQGLTNSNPLADASLFTAAKDVHAVGTQTIDGVSTTEYAGSFASRAALAREPASLRKSLAPALDKVRGNIHFKIWIDARHHIRRLTEIEQVSGETVTTTITFTSINQPVHITLPPAGSVASLPSGLASGL
jgi:hypothetical protein